MLLILIMLIRFLYRGKDALNVFCNNLNEIRDDIKERMHENKEIEMTDEDKEAFNNAAHCFVCGEEFRNTYKTEKEAEKYKKVRDHCHFTGRYRGCAHSICNLNYCSKHFKIPVFFHNMKKCDGHLIIQNAEQLSNKKKIDVIAQNSDKFINIGFDSLSVKDSSGLITASLDKLVSISITKYDDTDEKDRSKWIWRDNWQSNCRYSSKNDIIKTDLLPEKGVYPYDDMNTFDKFNEEQLPSKEQFYSRLSEEDITHDDCNKAKQIRKHFNIKNMGVYHDLYLQTDVLLLADVLEYLRTRVPSIMD